MDNLTLIERFRENEDLARKFHEVESRILSVLNFRDFFELLLIEISSIFDILMPLKAADKMLYCSKTTRRKDAGR